jgi:riboflavin synthase
VFTGLVEAVGTLERAEPRGDARLLRIAEVPFATELEPGESVAVNGVCLTVTSLGAGSFEAEAVATTLELTTLGSLGAGSRVNLERALRMGARLGGHLVQGHVDGTGEIVRVAEEGEHLLLEFTLPRAVAAVTVPQGSITVDGVSLTVNALPAAGVARVSIVPFTRDHTNLGARRVGEPVNLEGDVVGKYVIGGGASDVEDEAPPPARLTLDLLKGWGYE